MTEITRAYEFVIMATNGVTPDLTFTDEDFHGDAPPTYGGWRVNELQGSSESEPFTVSILDTSEQVTSNLSDADGRADLMGRVWRLRINEDGGGLATVSKGRIVGVQLNRVISAWDFQCGDERHWTRGREIYRNIATPTTQFYPPGLRSAWQYILEAAGTMDMIAEDVSDPNKVMFAIISGDPISERMISWLRDDLIDDAVPDGTTGNFTYLRINIDSTDREIISFSPTLAQAILSNVEEQEEHPVEINFVWVAWAAHGVSADANKTAFMYAPNAPPSDVLPYHIGGDRGADLMSELKDRYDDENVRYDANTFAAWDVSTNPGGLLANPNIPDGHLRITEPWNLGEFEERLFMTLGLAPFPNAAGEITPRFITLPDTTNPSALTQITSAKLRGGHPTFQQVGQQIVTVLIAKYKRASRMRRLAIEADSDWPADLIRIFDYEEEYTHDRIDDLGRYVHTVEMLGYWGAHATLRAKQLKEEIFNRYGDGPIRGRFSGMSSLDDVAAGDFVVIDLASYPDLSTRTRGGLRLVQAMEVRHTAFGPEFEYTDAGVDENALAAPSVSIIKNTTRPKHDVDVTISGLPAGATYLLQLQVGSDERRTFAIGTANEMVTIKNLPSGTLITPYAKAILIAQVGSAWATTTGVTLTSLTAPSAPNATASNLTITLTWTNGEADYRVMPTLGGNDYLLKALPAGTTRWTFTGLSASTLYTVGVKHVDEFGGESAAVTDTATTASAGSLQGVRNFRILQGFADAEYPSEPQYGEGIEVGWDQAPERHVVTVLHHATDSSFTANKKVRRFTGVQTGRALISSDGVTRYVRIRHETEDGAEWTSWSGTRQVVPVPLTRDTPEPKDLSIVASAEAAPGIDGAGNPGFNVDVSYDLGGDATHLAITVTFSGPTFYFYTTALTGTGTHRLRNQGNTADQFFGSAISSIRIGARAQIGAPIALPNDAGRYSNFGVLDFAATGSGVRAELTVGGATPMSDYFVPGSSITFDQDADGRLRINTGGGLAVYDFGAKSANFALDADNSWSQKGSISASVSLTGISNLAGAEPFNIRVACGANTLTLSSGAFEGPQLTFTGDCAVSFVDFGTGKIIAMGADY